MFLSKFLIFLLPLVNGQYVTDEAIYNGNGPRTGQYINIEKYPYIVSIRLAKSRKVICTGILITFSWVLSVPYCFMLTPEHYKRKGDSERFARKHDVENNRTKKRTHHYEPFSYNGTLFASAEENLTEEQLKKSVIHLEPKTFKIIAGASSVSDCFSAEGQVRNGESIVVHPDFKLSEKKLGNARHELALLKTNMPFVEQNNVQKAPVLDRFLLEKNPSRTCKLVGWGRGKTMKPLSHLKTTISEINVQIFNSSKCRIIENTYRKAIADDDEDPWFCSYDEKNKAIPVCQSDSGGPLVCNDKVVGLMSWLRTPICYYNRTEYIYKRPIYYCKIYSDLEWVQNVLGESSSRMSIQIQDDSSSSILLLASRIVMAITTAIIMLSTG